MELGTTMIGKDACCEVVLDRAQLRRRRIIESARNLFIRNGFHATGVAQIAKESGVAVGQIYRDFDAKEEIVAAIVEGDCARLLERDSLHYAIALGDTDAVWNWLRQFVRPTVDREAMVMFAEIIAESTRNERIAAIFARARDDVRTNTQAAFALLAPDERCAADRELLAELVVTQSLGLKQQMLLQPAMDIKPLVDAIMIAIIREVDAMNRMEVERHDERVVGAGRVAQR